MNLTRCRGSIKTDLLVGLASAMGFGLILAPLSGIGWLATKLSLPVIVAVAVAVGIGAGIFSARRKPPTSGLRMGRST